MTFGVVFVALGRAQHAVTFGVVFVAGLQEAMPFGIVLVGGLQETMPLGILLLAFAGTQVAVTLRILLVITGTEHAVALDVLAGAFATTQEHRVAAQLVLTHLDLPSWLRATVAALASRVKSVCRVASQAADSAGVYLTTLAPLITQETHQRSARRARRGRSAITSASASILISPSITNSLSSRFTLWRVPPIIAARSD